MSASANLHAEGKLPSDQLHLLACADLSIIYLRENAIWLALIAPILPAVANQNILLHFLCTAVRSNRSNWISILLEKCGNMFFTELDINLTFVSTLQWWMGVMKKYTDIQLLKRSVWKKLLACWRSRTIQPIETLLAFPTSVASLCLAWNLLIPMLAWNTNFNFAWWRRKL